ncbi:MAG: ribosome silencing factor [Pseudodesulfovibrio sp.]|uniref:Ribosomal silencing factor RsfS n=2 Tax=Desulfovibrionaceae TaxID=194924 RepID=E6VZ32_PSEA9|nr:ribosome silencing factor [Pseudodesulfovibrio aespoeensis]MBU4191527.1 ribosome silencing factor [Pseudomonadota bacterium]MBV1766509.1 ribosome silencing factor [Pseudodesulfovibrio sp.]ADU62808.1 iojap-like protein [Pseudodesulfovibrio aespoeensis Aspo-2]MBU4245318.1 ribosome silencing factor [Pseudomonadota bacterium]MBU4379379.1 ribosome silencing factor [Pseudomonadota bacterium]
MKKENKFSVMSGREKSLILAEWLDEKQGMDVVIMDVARMSSVTDVTVIVSARGMKHAQALADAVLARAAESSIEFLSMEGYQSGEWILMDLNDVLIHIFQGELRDFYNIEGMWSEAPRIPYTA